MNADVYQYLRADEERMKELGWDVKDDGRQLAMQPGLRDLYILSLFGGDDDGHRVNIEVVYRERPGTGNFTFFRAQATWPQDSVQTRIATQTLLWQLIEAYAPKGDG